MKYSFSIHRTTDPFVRVPRVTAQDSRLSLQAKGMLAVLLSLPSDWKYLHGPLFAMSEDGKTASTSALEELVEAGYITRERQRDNKGRWGVYHYEIYDVGPEHRKTEHGSGQRGKPAAENPQRKNRSGKPDRLLRSKDKEEQTNTDPERASVDEESEEAVDDELVVDFREAALDLPDAPGEEVPPRDRIDPLLEFPNYWRQAVGWHWTGQGQDAERQNDRARHLCKYWTKKELVEALRVTASADRPGWKYFKRVVETIRAELAAAESEPDTKPAEAKQPKIKRDLSFLDGLDSEDE